MKEADWSLISPTLVLSTRGAALHFPQEKTIEAARVVEHKLDLHVVTVGADLNGKNLAVLTVRQDGKIIETIFLTDHGLDSHRYRHLKKIANMNEDAARKCASAIASICARYPGCILLFERLRKISLKGGAKSRRMNRRQNNQLRGKIRQYAVSAPILARQPSLWKSIRMAPITALPQMWRERQEVLRPKWHQWLRQVGESVLVPRLRLRSKRRLLRLCNGTFHARERRC